MKKFRKYTIWSAPVQRAPELEQLDMSAPPKTFTEEEWAQMRREMDEWEQWVRDRPKRQAFNEWLRKWCAAWLEIGWHASVDIRLNNLLHELHWGNR